MRIATEHAAIRAVLHGAIDYAGLFPPAALDMANAVAEYASERRGPDRWALGRFVLPVARLGEFEALAAPSYTDAGSDPWRVAAIGAGVAGTASAIAQFNARNAPGAVIDAIEVRAESVEQVELWRPLVDVVADVFIEIPVGDALESIVAAVGRTGAKAKMRTGGVTSDAFPSAARVLRFLTTCYDANVPCKVTAGLHHPLGGVYPLTYASDADSGQMFGYLNVFLAASIIGARGAPETALHVLRAGRDAPLHSDAIGITLDGVLVPVESILRMRLNQLQGFGSCSFSEPLDEISTLLRSAHAP